MVAFFTCIGEAIAPLYELQTPLIESFALSLKINKLVVQLIDLFGEFINFRVVTNLL
jgi:hypothetical protein